VILPSLVFPGTVILLPLVFPDQAMLKSLDDDKHTGLLALLMTYEQSNFFYKNAGLKEDLDFRFQRPTSE
jgi:hypothetical protein